MSLDISKQTDISTAIKLSDYVSDFTGATDQTANFSNAVANAGGKEIYLKSGTVATNTQFRVSSSLKIAGEGTLKTNTVDKAVLEVYNSADKITQIPDVNIQDIHISDQPATTNDNFAALSLFQTAAATIQNVKFNNVNAGVRVGYVFDGGTETTRSEYTKVLSNHIKNGGVFCIEHMYGRYTVCLGNTMENGGVQSGTGTGIRHSSAHDEDTFNGLTQAGSTATDIVLSATETKAVVGATLYIQGKIRTITAWNDSTKTATVATITTAPASGVDYIIVLADKKANTGNLAIANIIKDRALSGISTQQGMRNNLLLGNYIENSQYGFFANMAVPQRVNHQISLTTRNINVDAVTITDAGGNIIDLQTHNTGGTGVRTGATYIDGGNTIRQNSRLDNSVAKIYCNNNHVVLNADTCTGASNAIIIGGNYNIVDIVINNSFCTDLILVSGSNNIIRIVQTNGSTGNALKVSGNDNHFTLFLSGNLSISSGALRNIFHGKVSGSLFDNSTNTTNDFSGLTGIKTLFDSVNASISAIATDRVCRAAPICGSATLTNKIIGFDSLTTVGTLTSRTKSPANQLTYSERIGIVSAGTAGSYAAIYEPVNRLVRGNGSYGGYVFICQFCCTDAATVAGAIQFVGLINGPGAPTSSEPSALVNFIGVGHGSADTNLKIFYGYGASSTTIDLGANFPANTLSTDIYEVKIVADKSVSTAKVTVTRLNTGDTYTSNALTHTTTPLSAKAYRYNNATALPVSLDILNFYTKS